jgi:hypothetical protein
MTSLAELEAQPALAHSCLGDHAQHAAAPVERPGERLLQGRHLVRTAHEAREPARAGEVEAAAQCPHARKLEAAHRLGHALQLEGPEVAQLEVAGDEPRDVFAGVDLARVAELLQAGGQPHHEALGRVVHAQVVADLADHHVARVERHAHGEGQAPLALELLGVVAQALAQVQRRVAGPLGVVLVGDRRAEQRHDAVARVLVDGALEAVHALRKDLEEAVQHPVPLLGIECTRQLHGALHVREEHAHLLALALQGAARREDLLREVPRRVVAGLPPGGRGRSGLLERAAALHAEARLGRVVGAAGVTTHGQAPAVR